MAVHQQQSKAHIDEEAREKLFQLHILTQVAAETIIYKKEERLFNTHIPN